MRQIIIKIPDIAMNISVLVTRNSSYIPLPASGTFMDAQTGPNSSGTSKCALGNIEGQTEVDSLTFGLLDESKALNIVRVRKGCM